MATGIPTSVDEYTTHKKCKYLTLTSIGIVSPASTSGKLYFYDDGVYIGVGTDGKLTIYADGTGADDITLSGTTTASDNITLSTTKKLYLRDTGAYVNSSAVGVLTESAATRIDHTVTAAVSTATLLLVNSSSTQHAAVEFINGITGKSALKIGNSNWLWFDSTGSLRYSSTQPTDDTSGASVGI